DRGDGAVLMGPRSRTLLGASDTFTGSSCRCCCALTVGVPWTTADLLQCSGRQTRYGLAAQSLPHACALP
ncbi:MAG: hypothetical protein J2P54_26310, partial [Bradyrhizobiaceae bacterium]|nr:hypothetical protein [Bradyrhizobiaceae bacterium]